MTTNTNNSRPQRQTLASQIDRLESILATLTENLGQTVAEAAQEAVGKAVELAVKEVLTNPELLRALQAQAAPAMEQAKTTSDSSLAKTLGQTWQRTRDNAAWAGAKVGEHAAAAGSWLARTCESSAVSDVVPPTTSANLRNAVFRDVCCPSFF
jgi:hypothetical protein